MRKPTIWVPTRSDTNRAVQSQKIEAGNFGFRKRNCTIRVAKTKALISFAVTAKLICALFSPMQIVGFPMQWLNIVLKLILKECFVSTTEYISFIQFPSMTILRISLLFCTDLYDSMVENA